MKGLQAQKPGGRTGDRLGGGDSPLKGSHAGRTGLEGGARPGRDSSLKGGRERPGGGGAFQGAGNGKEARMSADRGRASRQQSSAAVSGRGGGGIAPPWGVVAMVVRWGAAPGVAVEPVVVAAVVEAVAVVAAGSVIGRFYERGFVNDSPGAKATLTHPGLMEV